jgi:hypothetical protein
LRALIKPRFCIFDKHRNWLGKFADEGLFLGVNHNEIMAISSPRMQLEPALLAHMKFSMATIWEGIKLENGQNHAIGRNLERSIRTKKSNIYLTRCL